MTKKQVTVWGQDIELVFHYVDGEISEIYAIWDGMELYQNENEENVMHYLETYFGGGN